MRGELDDALARLERWDEVRRQLHQEATSGEPLLDEVVHAVTAILARRRSATVTLTVTDTTGSSSVELVARDGTVTTGAPGDAARPNRSAARLAEMIRQNPGLLDGER